MKTTSANVSNISIVKPQTSQTLKQNEEKIEPEDATAKVQIEVQPEKPVLNENESKVPEKDNADVALVKDETEATDEELKSGATEPSQPEQQQTETVMDTVEKTDVKKSKKKGKEKTGEKINRETEESKDIAETVEEPNRVIEESKDEHENIVSEDINEIEKQKKIDIEPKNKKKGMGKNYAPQTDVSSLSTSVLTSAMDINVYEADNMSDSEENRALMLLTEDYDRYLTGKMEEQSSTYSSTLSGSYQFTVHEDTLKLKADFLRDFEELPDIDELYSTSDEAELRATSILADGEDPEQQTDIGRFVDPMTGESFSSTSSSSLQVEQEEENDVEEDIEAESVELEIAVDDRSQDDLHDQEPEQDAFDALSRWEDTKVEFLETDILAALEAARNENALRNMTAEFLHELFNEAVNLAELKDERAKLALSLDKKLLWRRMKVLINIHESSLALNRILNRKLAEHFKRSKNIRSITPLEINMELEERAKYYQRLQALDKLMEKESALTDHNRNKILEVSVALNELEAETINIEEEFDELVRYTIVRRRSEYLKNMVDTQLSLMTKKRNEISNIRLVLIYRQHALAKLNSKMEDLEQISEDLHMTTFIHMQTETQALDKKIEERNTDLNRLRTTHNSNLHILAHLNEKREILEKLLEKQNAALLEVQKERMKVRAELFEQKMLRTKIRQDMRDISVQGGLLDKPLLMFDFDDTVEKNEKLGTKVDELKLTLSEILQKIDKFQKKLSVAV